MDKTPEQQAQDDLAAIPKIPYSRGLRLSWSEILRILMAAAALAMLLTMQGPCSQAVSKFVVNFDQVGSGSSAVPRGANAGPRNGSGFVHLQTGLTDEQMKQQIDQARGSAATIPQPAAPGSASPAMLGSASPAAPDSSSAPSP